jgi:hypothetical protein
MNRFRQSRAVHFLALATALALGLLPADLAAGCSCTDCACQASAEDGTCCCSAGKLAHSPEGLSGKRGNASPLGHSCCARKTPRMHECSPLAACSAGDGCRCEVARSQATADLSARAVRPDKTSYALGLAAALPVVASCNSGISRTAVAHPPESTPPLRILYCSWRN